MFVLDTNTLIYFFKGEGRVAEHLWSTPPHEIAVPAVVLYELHVGIAKSTHPQKRLMQLRQFLGCTRVLPFGQGEAECAARVRADLELRGEGIGPMDTLIAGTALAHQGTLITRNLREFERIVNLPVQSWY
jgi:tRNA(fMet)-specific endonuclease VapC